MRFASILGRFLFAGVLGLAVVHAPVAAQAGPNQENQRPLQAKPARKGANDRNLDQAGLVRTYRLHLPGDLVGKPPLALVIALHGMGMDGKSMEALTGFSDLADRKGFAVVYPDGLNRLWRFWSDEDVKYLMSLIDQLVKEGIIDSRRVYVTGISNGAYMTNRLACDVPDRVAATAPVAGTMSKLQPGQLKLRRPVPMLYMHGTRDAIVGYDGKDVFTKRKFSMAAVDFVEWWAKQDGCAETPVIDKLPKKTKDDMIVERHGYRPGKDGAEVVFYKIVGGGHTWPGGFFQPEQILGKVCRDINASEVIWEFFTKSKLAQEK